MKEQSLASKANMTSGIAIDILEVIRDTDQIECSECTPSRDNHSQVPPVQPSGS